MIIDCNREYLLGLFLTDYVFIKLFFDLMRSRNILKLYYGLMLLGLLNP